MPNKSNGLFIKLSQLSRKCVRIAIFLNHNRKQAVELTKKGFRLWRDRGLAELLKRFDRINNDTPQDIHIKKLVYQVSRSNFLQALKPINQVSIDIEGDNIVLCASGNDPYMETAPLNLGEGERYWLKMTMDFPEPTSFQLFFQRPDEIYNEADSKIVSVQSGRSRIILELPDPGTIEKIRIDPGVTPGRYILYDFFIIIPHSSQEQVPAVYSFNTQLPSLPKVDRYEAWLQVNTWNEKRERHLRQRLHTFKDALPRISVVVPVYNPDAEFLTKMIASVTNQVYENWELCLADDCSSDPSVLQVLRDAECLDSRIRVVYRTENSGISEATNAAATIATGEFLAFMDHDDELTPDALAEIALYIARNPETDFVYSDDDKIDVTGRRYDPQFKHDWSPELLVTHNYINHMTAIRRDLFQQLGGLRSEFDTSQDHDLALRATEKSRHVGHIPQIIYHWRSTPNSGASRGDSKAGVFEIHRKVVKSACERRRLKCEVYTPEWAKVNGNVLSSLRFPDQGPSVTIVIPTKNRWELLKNCLTSLRKTTYKNYNVIIIDNGSDDKSTLDFLSKLDLTVLRIPSPKNRFNFSYINNEAVKRIETEFILFMNNDIEVIEPGWLSQMVGYGQINGVGAVGAKLLYPDATVQHAGIVHGVVRGLPDHAMRGLMANDPGYTLLGKVTRNCTAVTAACLLTRRELFLRLGAFNQDDFAVQYNDVDYCLRLEAEGYRSVVSAESLLVHHEEASRCSEKYCLEENLNYLVKYRCREDKYYSPHLLKESKPCFKIVPRLVCSGVRRPIRVLFFTHNLNYEGAPLVLLEAALALKEREVIEPEVVSLVDGPLRNVYEASGVKVTIVKNGPGELLSLNEFLAATSELETLIRDEKIELVYANTVQTWHGIHAARNMRIPSIWNIHESEPLQTYFQDLPSDLIAKKLESFGYPYRVIFGSLSTQLGWSELETKYNFMWLHNVIKTEEISEERKLWDRISVRDSLGINSEEVALLCLGTVCERKGQQDILEALNKLSEDVRNKIKVFIVGISDIPGTESYINQLQKTLDAFSPEMKTRVKLLPSTPQIFRYYVAADIFLCTSRIECFPRVTQLAMAHGLPIITTPVFGLSEQIWNGVNGSFYDPGDVRTLAREIEKLIRNEKIRNEMAQKSQLVLSSMPSFDEMIDEMGQIILEAYMSGS